MSKNNKIWSLIVLLVVIVAVMGVLFSFQIENRLNVEKNVFQSNVSNSYFEVSTTTNKPVSRVLVNDRFTKKLDKDANIIVIGDDGSIYSIKSGSVLVGGALVEAKENSYSILRVNNFEKSVQTE